MKVLFIGGTGLISSACSEMVVNKGMELTVLNRAISSKYVVPGNAERIIGDINSDPERIAELMQGQYFDVIVDWIAYKPADIARDLMLFLGKTDQFFFISSASVYQKPPRRYLVTENMELSNPFWEYSRDKIACEHILLEAYRNTGFPVTIVRPSLTYGPSQIPLIMGNWNAPYTIVERIKRGKKIIIPGDGTSLWVLTWNEDFAKGIVALFGRKDAIGEAFHITSDEVLTWDQICQELGTAMGISPNIIHIPSDLIAAFSESARGSLTGDKANSVVFDNSKIKRFVPDYECEITWAEGVRKSLSWFEADPVRQIIDDDSNVLWDRIISAYERALPPSINRE